MCAVLCGMLVPPSAAAVTVVNTVESHSSTGGYSAYSYSKDGISGQDGADGKDGAPGQSGASVVSGNGSTSVHIESYINGEKVIDTYETNPEKVVSDVSASHHDDEVSVEAQAFATRNIMELLTAIRLTLLQYVTELF